MMVSLSNGLLRCCCAHDEKCAVTVPEVVIRLSWNTYVAIITTIVDATSIVDVHKRRHVVGLADVVVDDM